MNCEVWIYARLLPKTQIMIKSVDVEFVSSLLKYIELSLCRNIQMHRSLFHRNIRTLLKPKKHEIDRIFTYL